MLWKHRKWQSSLTGFREWHATLALFSHLSALCSPISISSIFFVSFPRFHKDAVGCKLLPLQQPSKALHLFLASPISSCVWAQKYHLWVSKCPIFHHPEHLLIKAAMVICPPLWSCRHCIENHLSFSHMGGSTWPNTQDSGATEALLWDKKIPVS